MENIEIVEQKSETLEIKKARRSAAVDRALHKVVSRKLLVWGTATVAMFMGMVDATNWVDVCMVYIGSEAAANMVMALRGKK
jgi:hypothetical protein